MRLLKELNEKNNTTKKNTKKRKNKKTQKKTKNKKLKKLKNLGTRTGTRNSELRLCDCAAVLLWTAVIDDDNFTGFLDCYRRDEGTDF